MLSGLLTIAVYFISSFALLEIVLMCSKVLVAKQGIHPSIRGEVWEFLLGCYDPKSTFEERDEIRQRRR